MRLIYKKLHPDAIAPTVAHPGEDLGFDLYAVESHMIQPHQANKVRTGIAAHYEYDKFFGVSLVAKYGLEIKDRSSLAAKGLFVSAGIIDAGYTGELVVIMGTRGNSPYLIQKGDKIAQLLPRVVLTDVGIVEAELGPSLRGESGFGSTGR